MKLDPRVDAKIEKAEEFAKPILAHLRNLVHQACPDVEENIKWGSPSFEYSGAILCFMASFKNHCAFGFWKGDLLFEDEEALQKIGKTAMGELGKITSLADLPKDEVIIRIVKKAMIFNEKGIKAPRYTKKTNKEDLEMPEDLEHLLIENPIAKRVFDEFSYTNQKDYLEWITEAKTEITRNKRLATTIEWLLEGKIRNWKYVK